MFEEIVLRYLIRRYPALMRPGSKFFTYGLAFVLTMILGCSGMVLWIILKPLPSASDFTQVDGVVSKASVKNARENGLQFLWLYLNGDPKLYVYAYPFGKRELQKMISIGDTAKVTVPKSDLPNPKRATVIAIEANGSSFGSIPAFIDKKSESKKYAWLMLIPAVLGLVFLHGFRERNIEKAWELERSRTLDPVSGETGTQELF